MSLFDMNYSQFASITFSSKASTGYMGRTAAIVTEFETVFSSLKEHPMFYVTGLQGKNSQSTIVIVYSSKQNHLIPKPQMSIINVHFLACLY